MFVTWTLFGCIAAFTVSGLCCNSKEYLSKEGLCCPMCRQGTYIHKICTEKARTDCRPCMDNTYMDEVNFLEVCFNCTSCGQGLFALHVCTTTTDTVCDASEGYFCKAFWDETRCSLAQKHTQCSPGHRIKVPGTSRADTVCEPCPPGYFSQEGVNCSVWTYCSEPQIELKEGSATSDVVCGRRQSRHRYFLIAALLQFVCVTALIGCCISGKNTRSRLPSGISTSLKPYLAERLHPSPQVESGKPQHHRY